MTAPGEPHPHQSRFSEAVEQVTDLTQQCLTDVSDLAQHQADSFSSGHYGTDDLVSAQVGLLRLYVRHTVKAAVVLPGALGLMAYSPTRTGSGGRTIRVAIPGHFDAAALSVSDLVQPSGDRVASSAVTLAAEPDPGTGTTVVTLTVTCSGLRNGTYRGSVKALDDSVSRDFVVALSEVGDPVPPPRRRPTG